MKKSLLLFCGLALAFGVNARSTTTGRTSSVSQTTVNAAIMSAFAASTASRGSVASEVAVPRPPFVGAVPEAKGEISNNKKLHNPYGCLVKGYSNYENKFVTVVVRNVLRIDYDKNEMRLYFFKGYVDFKYEAFSEEFTKEDLEKLIAACN